MLLRKLQDVFDEAKHEDIVIAIELMESLQAHAKKLMWTKLKPDSPEHETCGRGSLQRCLTFCCCNNSFIF